nr:MAG TPA: hypothetical protein [Caudoviricetes sp.]
MSLIFDVRFCEVSAVRTVLFCFALLILQRFQGKTLWFLQFRKPRRIVLNL